MTAQELRRIECHACDGEVTFPLEYGFAGPDLHCPNCGVLVSSHADGLAAAKKLGGHFTIAEATAIAMRRTYDEMTDLARRLYADPQSATSDEMDALSAIALLRAAGLPCHAPKRSN